MNLNRILFGAAAAGLALAAAVALRSNARKPPTQPVAQPAQAPYADYIGGAGLVEASDQNIEIGTTTGGVVQTVPVQVGDRVKSGQPLFTLDDRELVAERRVKQAAVAKAEGALQEALAAQADYRDQYALVKDSDGSQAVSVDDVQKRRNAVALYDAKVVSARAELQSAQADLAQTGTDLDRLIVRSPVTGEVLQVNVRPGQFAAAGELSTPLMLVGKGGDLDIRVDVDENDAWRFRPGSRAMAFLRGNRDLKAPLTFVRTEPYVVGKTSLTGSSTERIDTRVLKVVYRFRREALPAYVGQQVDVFIETPAGPAAAGSRP